VVGALDGDYSTYSCIEMDDAILAQSCHAQDISFGSVRNISDPAQPAGLPAKIQAAWGGAVYSAYGFYTSYNSALVTAAII
jgi:nucleoside phosphorylase